jgi:oligosaccharide repeat unit polymerase
MKEILMEQIAFWSFLIVLIIFFVIFYKKKNKQIIHYDNLDPFMIFSATFILYSVVGGYDRLGEYTSDIYIPMMFYISVCIGYVMFSFGYLKSVGCCDNTYEGKRIKIGIKRETTRVGVIRKDDLLMFIILIVYIIVNFSVFSSMILNFGNGISYVETSARSARNATTGTLSLLHSYFMILMIAYPFYRVYKTCKVTITDVIILFICAVYCVTSGYRSTLVFMMLAVLGLINYRYKYIKLRYLVIIGTVALMLLVLVGHLRARNNISDMIKMYNEYGNKLFKLTGSGEFRNPIGTFYNYATAISSGKMSFNWGYTWIVDILIFIPYFIWPGRPLPWSEQYMLDFYPSAPSGTGHGWYILNDGYMSFGILGVALEMFIVGMVLGKLYCFFIKRKENPMYMVMYLIFMLFNFTMVRTGFLGTVKNYILQISLFAIIIVVSNGFKVNIKKYD